MQRSIPTAGCVVAAMAPSRAAACPWCRGAVDAGIYDDTFWFHAAGMLSPALLLVGLALTLPAWLERRGRAKGRRRR
jgi:hypothetical protein